jgi:hypothetical protein
MQYLSTLYLILDLMLANNSLKTKRRKRNFSFIVSGLLVLALLVGGSVIAATQVQQSQDLASQASNSVSVGECSSAEVGSTYKAAAGADGCPINAQQEYKCNRITVTVTDSKGNKKVTTKYLWQKNGTCSVATNCNNASGRSDDCPCANGNQCRSGYCVQSNSSGPSLCKTRPNGQVIDPNPGTQPGTPPTQPAPNPGGQPGNPGTPTQPFTDPKCTIGLYKLNADNSFTQIEKPKAGDAGFLYCNTTGGPVTTTYWAYYSPEMKTNNGVVAAGDMVYSPPKTQIVLKAKDRLECVPATIDANNVPTYYTACRLDIN